MAWNANVMISHIGKIEQPTDPDMPTCVSHRLSKHNISANNTNNNTNNNNITSLPAILNNNNITSLPTILNNNNITSLPTILTTIIRIKIGSAGELNFPQNQNEYHKVTKVTKTLKC